MGALGPDLNKSGVAARAGAVLQRLILRGEHAIDDYERSRETGGRDERYASLFAWQYEVGQVLQRLAPMNPIADSFSGRQLTEYQGNMSSTEVLTRARLLLGFVRSMTIDFDGSDDEPRRTADDSSARISTDGGVFVVHGHDTATKLEVVRTLERVGLKPILLHERPDGGKTIIEKLEANARVGFAVVILTGDDLVADKSTGGAVLARARQNVIFELGYFVGRLGRGRVLVLYQPGVEMPSDLSGVLYKALDSAGAWKIEVLRELRDAGFNVDLNRL